VSDEPGRLTRLTWGPAWREAVGLVRGWMEEAGLLTRLDAVGNLVGRREGRRAGAPALLLGSHLDTVIDAGRFDGVLGVLLALAAVEELEVREKRPAFALEVVAFADEEGVRFPCALTGSRAMAGTLDPAVLGLTDRDGTTLAEALRACGLDPEGLVACARRPGEILGFLEAHIEQGPVLEQEGVTLGLVRAIAGATRLEVGVEGRAGHAGTVPMRLRRDALAGAAEMVLAVERLARGTEGLVATVGRLEVLPGAVNTIPGRVRFTIDLRSSEDGERTRVLADLEARLEEIACGRGLALQVVTTHEARAVRSDPKLLDALARAQARLGLPERRLVSGAGHDAMAIAAIAPVAMLFVRCREGISHDPAEYAAPADIEAALAVLVETLVLLSEEFR
jgi:allantoate deiminase